MTGSIAAHKAVDLASQLTKDGFDVHAVMTAGAQQIIHPNLMEFATGNPVVAELTGTIEHVLFTTGKSRADLVLIAPATANTIGKIAAGIDDTPVTSYVSSALGAGIPILIAPAMHDTMLAHPIIQDNVRKLEKVGIVFIPPMLAEGKAKLAEIEAITASVISRLSRKDLEGVNLLITGGPTVERIDQVRVLTNRSSGKMAVALAATAESRGARVTLVYGPASADPPRNVRVVPVQTAEEMHRKTLAELSKRKYHVMVAAAAVSDYRPTQALRGKLESSRYERLRLDLVRTPKIVQAVKRASPSTFLVIFKAEAAISEEKMVAKARQTLKDTRADLVVLNDVSKDGVGFGSDYNEVIVIDPAGTPISLERAPKPILANRILSLIVERLPKR